MPNKNGSSNDGVVECRVILVIDWEQGWRVTNEAKNMSFIGIYCFKKKYTVGFFVVAL